MEKNINEDVKESIELIEWIQEHNPVEAGNYESAKNFIKEKGYVSPTFLQSLRSKKQEVVNGK